MATTLKAIEVIVSPDGRVTTDTPLPFTHPTKAILTAMIEDENEPNETTRAAMEESTDGQTRFDSVDALIVDLES